MNPPSRPVKVCFVCPKAYKLFNADINEVIGGAEVDCYLLAVELAKDPQFEVSFVTADYGQPATEVRENVKIIKSLTFGQNSLTGAIKIWRAMSHANADVYFQEAASIGTALVAAFCTFNRKAFCYRTANEKEASGMLINPNKIVGQAFKWALKRAAAVIVQSEIDKSKMQMTMGISAHVIKNAQIIPPHTPLKKNTILWVGRSVHVKRPDLFLELVKSVPSEHFTMICQRATGDSDYDMFIQEAQKLSNLSFINSVPFKAIDQYFAAAKILINTSDSEGFPNAFVQAFKQGTPVLSLRIDPDGFLLRNRCGISCGGDWELFVNELKNMLAENRYLLLGENARKYAVENHSIEKLIAAYKAIFKKLAQNLS